MGYFCYKGVVMETKIIERDKQLLTKLMDAQDYLECNMFNYLSMLRVMNNYGIAFEFQGTNEKDLANTICTISIELDDYYEKVKTELDDVIDEMKQALIDAGAIQPLGGEKNS